jgi:hypothetical protein
MDPNYFWGYIGKEGKQEDIRKGNEKQLESINLMKNQKIICNKF